MSDRRSRAERDADAAAPQSPIVHDTAQEMAHFFTKALQDLETNVGALVQKNDGSNPLSGLVQTLTACMVAQLRERVSSTLVQDPARSGATCDPPVGAAANDHRVREPPQAAAKSRRRARHRRTGRSARRHP